MSSIFKAIGSFFKKLWNVLRKILAIVLIIIAVIVIIWACIFCPPLGGVLFGIAFSSATAAFAFGCVLLVGAFLIDKDTASEAVGKIGEATGDAAESVGNAAGNVASGLIGGIFSSDMLPLILVGVGAYFLLTSSGTGGAATTGAANVNTGVNPKTDRVERDDNVVVATTDQLYTTQGLLEA